MFLNYLFVSLSGLLFALLFYVTNRYEKFNGSSIERGLILSFISFFLIALMFFVKGCIEKGCFYFPFSWFTLLLTSLMAIFGTACVLISIKILKHGKMAYYSLFMMVGAIVLPSITGMAFFHEKVSALKIFLILVMIFCCFLASAPSKNNKLTLKGTLLLLSVLLLNGIKGAILTTYKYNGERTAGYIKTSIGEVLIDNNVYVTYLGLTTAVISLIVWLIIRRKYVDQEKVSYTPKTKIISFCILPICYALTEGIGNYFLAFSTGEGALDASITYPISSGLTILFSLLVGIILLNERLYPKKVITIFLMIGATIGFIFI